MKASAARAEHTGNPVTDRIQGAIRELLVRVNSVLVDLGLIGLGSADIAMGDRDVELTVLDATNIHISLIDTHSAVRVLKLPNAPRRGQSYVRWLSNTTGGGFAVTLSTPKGGAVTLNNATTRAVIVKHDTIASLT